MDCNAALGFILAKLPQHLPQRKLARGIHLHRKSHCDYGHTCGLRNLMCGGIEVAFTAARDSNQEHLMTAKKPGLYANIEAKKERISNGSGEHMNAPGSKAAPSAEDFKKAAKTEKKTPAKFSK